MPQLTLAIMGATGKIGHYLTEELIKKGHKVRALGRDLQKLKGLKSKGAEIHSCDFTDSMLLSKLFSDCDAIFSFIPPGFNEPDVTLYRENVGEAIADAIENAEVTHVVNLSSIGAHLSSGTGPIQVLHNHEVRLNEIKSLNVLHFRPAFFMENFFSFIPGIKSSHHIASAINPDLPIPMVATQDIAHKICEFFDTLKFKGSSIFEFTGPDEVTMVECTEMIGKIISKPDLKYQHLSYPQEEKDLQTLGLKRQVAQLMVEMYKAFNDGKIVPTQQLTTEHRGKTTFQQFCKIFLTIYQSSKKAA